MSAELESVVWCPRCREVKGEVRRIPTGQEGVYRNQPTPDPLPKTCDCGTVLERKQ